MIIDEPNLVQYKRNSNDTDLLDNAHIYCGAGQKICTTQNLMRSTARGPFMARLLNAERAISGPSGICN